MKLDCLFINPGNQQETYQGLSGELTAVEPPIWCRLLSSFMEKRGASVEILDCVALGLGRHESVGAISLAGPALAVVVVQGHQPSASTQTMPSAISLCRALKELTSDIPILVVGGHPAALPDQTLRETGADFVCTGEGPYTISDLLSYLKANGGKWKYGYKGAIRGVVYWDHDNLLRNDPAPNVWSLDEEMPGGQWEKLPMEKYRAHVWHCLQEKSRQPYASIYTSLNCPWQCHYCMISTPFREGDALHSGKDGVNFYRMWSADSVIAEIGTLVEKYGVTNIKICDEMFFLNPKHVIEISDKIIERGYGDRLNIWCYSRIDSCRPEFLEKARRAGIKWVAVGIEAADDGVREAVDKNDFTNDDIYRTCKLIREAGVNLIANMIVGLPRDTPETMEKTLQMALEIQPEFLNLYPAMPYPGSKLYDSVKDHWNPEGGWSAFSMHGYYTHPMPTENLFPADVLKFRDDAIVRYFTDPGYLAMVKTKFGDRAVAEIKKLTDVRLKRKLLGD